jgi:hypothetical protein
VKANYTEFRTGLSVKECGGLFRMAVDKRPLKLKMHRFVYFTPTSGDDPFAQLDDAVEPDFEVGAEYQTMELYGSVVMSCLSQHDRTLVSLRSAGNMRGRVVTNSLVKHIVAKFQERDGAITVETGSGWL